METAPQRSILIQAIKNSLGICNGSCVGVTGCTRSCRDNVAAALEYCNINPTQLPIVDGRPQLTAHQRGLLRVYLGLETSGDTVNLEDSLVPPASSFGGQMPDCPDGEI